MAKTNFIVLAFCMFPLFAKPAEERPQWVDSWRVVYPDTEYVAQLGKATGKNGAADSKAVAANTAAQYISSKVQSELSSSMHTTTGQTKNGRLATSSERQNSQSVTVSVDLTLSSLMFTEPWYNKKEKTWYCVAYVEREKLWQQYLPTLQNARDKLFAFYKAAEECPEPLLRMKYYSASYEYESAFVSAYSFARILSTPLTEQGFKKDSQTVSSIRAKAEQEKNNCAFSISVKDDVQNTIYQSLKDALSNEGFAVKNAGEDAAYIVNAKVLLSDNNVQGVHVIKPTMDIAIIGKTLLFFSYSKQAANASGIDKEIASAKAVRLLKAEIEKSFINEFNEGINKQSQTNLQRLFEL